MFQKALPRPVLRSVLVRLIDLYTSSRRGLRLLSTQFSMAHGAWKVHIDRSNSKLYVHNTHLDYYHALIILVRKLTLIIIRIYRTKGVSVAEAFEKSIQIFPDISGFTFLYVLDRTNSTRRQRTINVKVLTSTYAEYPPLNSNCQREKNSIIALLIDVIYLAAA